MSTSLQPQAANLLTLTTAEMDRFNAVVQSAIEGTPDTDIQLALAHLKFLVNRAFDQARRCGA